MSWDVIESKPCLDFLLASLGYVFSWEEEDEGDEDDEGSDDEDSE